MFAKFNDSRSTPSRRKVYIPEERKTTNAKNSGHYILPATRKGITLTSTGPNSDVEGH